MQLETYLNAMANARASYFLEPLRVNANKRQRQYRAFRNRILRMFEELQGEHDAAMVYVEESDDLIVQHYDNWQKAKQRIAELEKELDKLYKEKSNRGAAIRNM